MITTELTYSLTSDIDITPFDSSAAGLEFLVVGSGRRIAVNSATASLLQFLRVARSQSELVAYAQAHNIGGADHDVVSELSKPPLNHLVSNAAPAEVAISKKPDSQYLFLKCDVFSPPIVSRIARCFDCFFEPYLACLMVTIIVLAHAAFLISGGYGHRYTLSFTTGQWVAAWIGAYLAVLFHEFGHCAACTRYGSKPGAVGIGFYLIWPVLYANTTDSWRLDRTRRCIVDVGGIYFQLLASALCIAVGKWLHSPVLLVISKSAILATAINLNPFFRFDGYWLVADATGIPNLREASSQFWKFALDFVLQRNNKATPPRLLRFARHLQLLFGIYCVSSLMFFAYVTFRSATFLPHLLWTIPKNGEHVWRLVLSKPFSMPAIRATATFCFLTLGAVQGVMFSFRRASRTWFALRSMALHCRPHNASSDIRSEL